MHLAHSIQSFVSTLWTVIPIGLGIIVALVITMVWAQDHLRKRADRRNHIWRRLHE